MLTIDLIAGLSICPNISSLKSATTACLHKGKFNGMGKREWIIFTGSLIIGNAYWTLACYMGITLFEWVWKAMAG